MLPILTIERKFPTKQKQKNQSASRRSSKILLEIKTSSPYKKHVTPFSLADKEHMATKYTCCGNSKNNLEWISRSCVVSGIELVGTWPFPLADKKSRSSMAINGYFKNGLWLFQCGLAYERRPCSLFKTVLAV